MGKSKNVSGSDLLVPTKAGGQRLVLAGGVIDDAEVEGHLDQPGRWEPVKAAKKSDNDSQEG